MDCLETATFEQDQSNQAVNSATPTQMPNLRSVLVRLADQRVGNVNHLIAGGAQLDIETLRASDMERIVNLESEIAQVRNQKNYEYNRRKEAESELALARLGNTCSTTPVSPGEHGPRYPSSPC
jgi:hypothetical protein